MDRDPYAGTGAIFSSPSEIRGPGYDTARQKDLMELAAKQAAMDAERRRLAMEQARLERDLLKPIPEGPKNIARKVRETSALTNAAEMAKTSTAARTSLPDVEDKARIAFSRAASLVKHPGFEAAVGMPNPFKGGFGVAEVPGTPAYDFASELEKSQAGAFSNAFETLKGAGAISEAEGKAATAALANVKSSTSEQQFKKNLQEYVDILKMGVDRARKKADFQPVPYSYESLMAEKQRRAAMAGRGQ